MEKGRPDFRGDLSAELLSNSFGYLPNVVYNKVLKADRVDGSGVNPSQVDDYIKDINGKAKPGDKVFIYFTAHGTEDPVIFGQTETTKTPGDEQLLIGKGMSSILTDDNLHSMLKGMDKVSKYVLIDACFSGGFWGNNNPFDYGDLEKLKNVSLFASALETIFAYYGDDGIGLFTKALSEGFSKNGEIFNADSNEDQNITFLELVAWSQKWLKDSKYKGQTVYEMGLGDPTVLTEDKWNPDFYKSEDFTDGISTVPIPGSMLLFSSGIAGLVCFCYLNRRVL
jgi:hypothetical protein